MNKPPRLFQLFALALVLGMAWANHGGYMVSSLLNPSDAAARSASGHLSHK
jgi:hypothetical protein